MYVRRGIVAVLASAVLATGLAGSAAGQVAARPVPGPAGCLDGQQAGHALLCPYGNGGGGARVTVQ